METSMPSRVVRGEILSSFSLSRVSRDAEAFFWRLLIAADDFGRLDGRIGVLRAVVFPAREDICSGEIERWVSELSGCDPDGSGPVIRYEVEGRPYLQLQSWEKHRSTSKRAEKSRFPGVPENPRGNPGDPRIPADPRPSDVWRLTSGECRVEPSAAALPAPIDPLPEPTSPEASPLLNLIAKREGSRREKELWLADSLDVMQVEADGDRKRLASLTVRWYRAYLGRERNAQGERRYQEAERRERERAAAAKWHQEHPQQFIEAAPSAELVARAQSLFSDQPLVIDREVLLDRSTGAGRGDRPAANGSATQGATASRRG